MCNMLCSSVLAPCFSPLSLCWSDIENGCLSLDHHQLHLSQLATTAFAFLVSTSIIWFCNVAHVSVSKTACACVDMLACECGGETGKKRTREQFLTASFPN